MGLELAGSCSSSCLLCPDILKQLQEAAGSVRDQLPACDAMICGEDWSPLRGAREPTGLVRVLATRSTHGAGGGDAESRLSPTAHGWDPA